MAAKSPIAAMLGDTVLVKRGGDMVAVPTDQAITAKYTALYFSAHWCPPCKAFTPVFAKAYSAQGADKEVEVVFISSDEDAKAFKGYYGEHPWAAVPFDEEGVRSELGAKFGVRGIPCVVVLNTATGALVTKDARGAITSAPTLKGLFH